MMIQCLLIILFSFSKEQQFNERTETRQMPAELVERKPASFIPPTIQEKAKKSGNPNEAIPPISPIPIPSSEIPLSEEEYGIFSDWWGVKKIMSENGVDVSIGYKRDFVRNTSGGVAIKSVTFDNLDLRANMDLEKLAGWSGWEFFVYALMNTGADSGNRPSLYVGDLQWTSNIETFVDDFRLYQAYIQKTFLDDKASILFGLHDLNSEFYVTNTATLFLHASFGLGLELSQSGINGPSVFPYTAPALRVRVEPSEKIYLQTAIFSARAGSPNSMKGSHFHLDPDEGRLFITELGIYGSEKQASKYSFGFWSYDRTFDHLSDTVTDSLSNTLPLPVSSSGAYVSLDQQLTDKWSVFATYGVTSAKSVVVKDNLTLGIVRNGWHYRPDDSFGLAMSCVAPGKIYRNLSSSDKQECAYELTYKALIAEGFSLQPDLQYIHNPGLDPNLEDAFVTSIRLEILF